MKAKNRLVKMVGKELANKWINNVREMRNEVSNEIEISNISAKLEGDKIVLTPVSSIKM